MPYALLFVWAQISGGHLKSNFLRAVPVPFRQLIDYLYLYFVCVCACVCVRMTFSWSTMTKGPVETNWATPGRLLSGTEHRWESHLSLPPSSLKHVDIHVLPASFTLFGSHTLAFSERLVLSWQHNRKRTAWTVCIDKCLVASVLLFLILCTPFTLRKKKRFT